MSTARYDPVTSIEDRPQKTSPSSHDDSVSSRLTPDSDDSEDDLDRLEDIEEIDGYELKGIGRHKGENVPSSSAVEDVEERDDDGADEPLAGHRRRRRRRRDSAQSFELYTPDEERRVRRKLDTRLVLFVALLYLMSFLDRSNIGNAKLAGLASDLQLSDDQYEWLLTIFYITYILFEWMTLCFKIFPPHIYISCCVFAWGVLASLQSLVSSFALMLVLRAFLAIGEAAFVGIPFYLSFFFRRDELAFRTGLFISAAPLATSFASTLAYAIVRFGSGLGIANWRLLFLIEGFPACLVAVWAWYWVPDSPATARWLNPREQKIATLRMRKESLMDSKTEKSSRQQAHIPRHKRKFKWNEVLQTLIDPKSYLTAGMFFCCNVAFSSMPVFLPTIVNQMGYSTLTSQGLSAPPFLFAFFVVILTAFLSDRCKSRSVPMMIHAALAMSGYIFLAVAGTLHMGHTLRYLALFPTCAGFFSAVTIVITWTLNNQASDEGKGTGLAVLNVCGQMGPLLGTRLYPDNEAPFFVKGMSACAIAMAVVGILAFTLRFVLQRENRRHARGGTSPREFIYMT